MFPLSTIQHRLVQLGHYRSYIVKRIFSIFSVNNVPYTVLKV
jgi:hypothetical protein